MTPSILISKDLYALNDSSKNILHAGKDAHGRLFLENQIF